MSDERRMELLSMSTKDLVEGCLMTEVLLLRCKDKNKELVYQIDKLKEENKLAITALETIGKYGSEGDSYGVFRNSVIGNIVHSVLDSRNPTGVK